MDMHGGNIGQQPVKARWDSMKAKVVSLRAAVRNRQSIKRRCRASRFLFCCENAVGHDFLQLLR